MRTVRTLSRGLVLVAALSLALPGLASAKDPEVANADPGPQAESAARFFPLPNLPAAPRSEVRHQVLPAWEEVLRTLVAKAMCGPGSACTSVCTLNCPCGNAGPLCVR
jgi:hypothetical protein